MGVRTVFRYLSKDLSTIYFPTSLTLNIDKIPRKLCGPHLHTQIHACLATNLKKYRERLCNLDK